MDFRYSRNATGRLPQRRCCVGCGSDTRLNIRLCHRCLGLSVDDPDVTLYDPVDTLLMSRGIIGGIFTEN